MALKTRNPEVESLAEELPEGTGEPLLFVGEEFPKPDLEQGTL